MKTNKMLETGKSVVNAVRGVLKFISQQGYGFATAVEGAACDVWFSVANVCEVRDGENHPLLVDSDYVRLEPGTMLMLLEPFDNGRGGLMTDGVCRTVDYQAAERAIAKRPYYRVWHSANLWTDGKLTPSGNQPYAEGSLKALDAKFPRGAKNDPCAAGYETGPINVQAVKWEKRTPTGGWEVCKDPRPLPANHPLLVTVKVMKNEDGKLREVWTGSTCTLLDLPGFKGGEFSFEQARKATTSDEVVWVEIADPRLPKAEVKTEVKAPEAPARKKAEKPATKVKAEVKGVGQTAPTGVSVAPPKKEKAKKVVTDLSQLALEPASK